MVSHHPLLLATCSSNQCRWYAQHPFFSLPLNSLILLQLPASKSKSTRTESPSPVSHSCPHSPSPGTTQATPSDIFSIPDSTDGAASYDKGKQDSVVRHVSDSILTILNEGFNEINEMLRKLAAHMKMPFHQVSDHYIRQHSHSHGGNIWNSYSMYFVENMEQELAHLPKGEHVTGTLMPDI